MVGILAAMLAAETPQAAKMMKTALRQATTGAGTADRFVAVRVAVGDMVDPRWQ
jgi:hypothetical protein